MGTRHGRCSRTMSRGIEMRVLDDANTGSFISSGCESIAEVRCSSFMNGVIHGIYSWDNALSDGES
jgi:hypothetical protein